MSLRERNRPGLGIIEPCLPSPAKAPPSGPAEYYVAVDRQLKSGFGTYEAAEKAAKEIKKRHPNPQVTVFDVKKQSHTAIEASNKRRE